MKQETEGDVDNVDFLMLKLGPEKIKTETEASMEPTSSKDLPGVSSTQIITSPALIATSSANKSSVMTPPKQSPPQPPLSSGGSNGKNKACNWVPENGKVCGKTFSKSYNLTVHMRMHKEVRPRPFQCSLCDQTFRQKAHLQRHEKTHGIGTKMTQAAQKARGSKSKGSLGNSEKIVPNLTTDPKDKEMIEPPIKITVLDRNSEKVRDKANEDKSHCSDSDIDIAEMLMDSDTSDDDEDEKLAVKSKESTQKQRNIEHRKEVIATLSALNVNKSKQKELSATLAIIVPDAQSKKNAETVSEDRNETVNLAVNEEKRQWSSDDSKPQRKRAIPTRFTDYQTKVLHSHALSAIIESKKTADKVGKKEMVNGEKHQRLSDDSIREPFAEIAAEEQNTDEKLHKKKRKGGQTRKNEGDFACEVVDCGYRTRYRGNLERHCKRWVHYSSQVTKATRTLKKRPSDDSIREPLTDIAAHGAEEQKADEKLHKKKRRMGRPPRNEGQFACEVVNCGYRTKNHGNLKIHCKRWSHYSSQVTKAKRTLKKQARGKYEENEKLSMGHDKTKDGKESTTKNGKSQSQQWFDGTRYKCGLCGRNDYKDSDHLRNHIRDAHKIKSSSKKRQSMILISISSHTCKICERQVVRNRQAIRSHMRLRHNMTFVEYDTRFMLNSENDEQIDNAISVVDKSMDVTGEDQPHLQNAETKENQEVMSYSDEAVENQVNESMDVDIVKEEIQQSEVNSIFSNSTPQDACLKISGVIGGITF